MEEKDGEKEENVKEVVQDKAVEGASATGGEESALVCSGAELHAAMVNVEVETEEGCSGESDRIKRRRAAQKAREEAVAEEGRQQRHSAEVNGRENEAGGEKELETGDVRCERRWGLDEARMQTGRKQVDRDKKTNRGKTMIKLRGEEEGGGMKTKEMCATEQS